MRSRGPAGLLLAVGGLVLLLLLVGSAGRTTTARFTDAATVTTGAVGALSVTPPATLGCSAASLTATLSWTADPRLDYQVVLRRTTAPAAVVSTRLVTGTASSVTYNGLADFGFVLGIGLGTYDFEVDVHSYVVASTQAPGTPWLTPTATTARLQVSAVVLGTSVACRP